MLNKLHKVKYVFKSILMHNSTHLNLSCLPFLEQPDSLNMKLFKWEPLVKACFKTLPTWMKHTLIHQNF